MKKLITILLLVLLSGCTNNVNTPVDTIVVDRLGEEVNTDIIVVNGREESVAFTDDNTNEDIIIKTDGKEYVNIFGNIGVYVSIENNTGVSQNVDILFSINDADVHRAFKYDGEEDVVVEEKPVIEKEEKVSATSTSATSTEELGAKKTTTKTKKRTKWKTLKVKSPKKYKDLKEGKMLGGISDVTLKPVGETESNKMFTDFIEAGEKIYYRVEVKTLKTERDEFFIEAFGEDTGYGHLDPWTYTQDFDLLNTADLDGQDSWNNEQAEVYAELYVNANEDYNDDGKSVELNTVGELGGAYYGRAVTGVTSGTVYFAMRVNTYGGAGTLNFRLAESGTVMIQTKVDNDPGVDNKFEYRGSAGWTESFDVSLNTWYVIKITFDTSTNSFDIYYKEKGDESFTTIETSAPTNAMSTIDGVYLGADTSWLSYLDSIGPYDPDNPPTPPAGGKKIVAPLIMFN